MKTSNCLYMFVLFVILLSGCSKDEDTTNPLPGGSTGFIKIAVASDIHYMAPDLLVQDGPAFQAYLAQDPKLLADSRTILQQLIVQINQDNPDLLIIPGDLTKDGELISHQQVIDLLKTQLNTKIKVLTLPGNHDIDNPDALSYDGSITTPVPSISDSDFVSMYHDFGYGQAISRDVVTLSYVAEPFTNMRIIFIDATIRPNPSDPSEPPLEGVIPDETLNWISDQVAAALSKQMQVFAVMHHNLIDHWTDQSTIYPGYVINNSAVAAEQLYNAGIRIIFTGHSHSNDITRYSGGDLYDIETGSTVSYPLPYRLVNYWYNDSVQISTKWVGGIELHGSPIEDYALNFLNTEMTNLFYHMLTDLFSAPDPPATDIAELEASAYAELSAGDEVMTKEEEQQKNLYVGQLTKLGLPLAAYMFSTTFTSWNTDLVPQDNELTLDLQARK